ncbi:NYN domain-containing protein [Streptosporangium sp. NPDC087985]|uniref:NYN domain-containing protein n=1 Tax=Streptosporangium sp. NPDC087985 TaxID=3366196 RepID=UPI0038017CB5
MDRCALFVDAGYLLADGAMAVHGTRHREAVSWDYPGLLKLLSNLSKERTGLPLLRCYWYEASVEGRRTAEHDALADIPGLKLRLSRIRPGRREGVDAQVHRDLMTLARNNAVCDAVVVSGDEDLAQVVCDAQDLGIRVTVVHITADGSWAVSRSLRQEGDDLIEIGGSHLRPYVSLAGGVVETPPLGNGHQPVGNGQVAAPPTTNDNGAPPTAPSAPRPAPAPPQPALPSYPSYNHEPPPAPAPPQQAPALSPSPLPVPSPLPAPNGPTGPMPATPQYGSGNTGSMPSYQPGQLGAYTGPQAAPVPVQNMANSSTTTLSDAVKAAHKEGHDFGESVAKDAPALWLEAVLARKPRMPSDLEARLLQGSSLPIDFLLHDEVRHALRRGFWDALERARR